MAGVFHSEVGFISSGAMLLPSEVVAPFLLLLLVAAEGRRGGRFTVILGHNRQPHFVGGEQLEVFLRSDVGRVRAKESAGQEEWLVAVRFKELDRCGGNLAV